MGKIIDVIRVVTVYVHKLDYVSFQNQNVLNLITKNIFFSKHLFIFNKDLDGGNNVFA